MDGKEEVLYKREDVEAVLDTFIGYLNEFMIYRIKDRMRKNIKPERKKGEWIKEHEEWFTDYPYKCTNCGEYSRARYHFCPNCGSDNRGEQDE